MKALCPCGSFCNLKNAGACQFFIHMNIYTFGFIVYNISNRLKMRIDNLMFKCLEFKDCFGHKVTISEIPVLLPSDPNFFMLTVRLEVFVRRVFDNKDHKENYSFKHYLASVLKRPVYHKIFYENLLNNA
ncbi:DUF2535 family protein [Peribacillus butanolivorans]|uniref:DUF2535 family protein n=1 Tax=Peribacillus butanolivorans TaxID=421767 RepID=UPI0036BF844E